jgi:hypothetical protein
VLVKISLALLIILNIYILAAISKVSRQDIGNNLKLIPSRMKRLFQKTRVDNDEQAEDLPKRTGKMDFSEQCGKRREKCDGRINCWHEVMPSKSQCVKCECSLCIHSLCPPAQKGK